MFTSMSSKPRFARCALRVASASTRCHAGLSTRALLLEWMSRCGPRPQRSPLETSSTSITPLAPSVMITLPSSSCAADGVEGGEERRLGPLLVHGAPADQHGAHARLLDERGGPRR